MYDDVRIMFSKPCKIRCNFGARSKFYLDFNVGLFTRRSNLNDVYRSLMLQADVPLLTTHTAHVDSLHLMSSRNSGSAEIGNVAVEVEVDIEAGGAAAVVIEAMTIGVMEIALAEKVVGTVRVELEAVGDVVGKERVDVLVGLWIGGADLAANAVDGGLKDSVYDLG